MFLQITSDEPESAVVSSLRMADEADLSFAIGSIDTVVVDHGVIVEFVKYTIELERIFLIPDTEGRTEQTQ